MKKEYLDYTEDDRKKIRADITHDLIDSLTFSQIKQKDAWKILGYCSDVPVFHTMLNDLIYVIVGRSLTVYVEESRSYFQLCFIEDLQEHLRNNFVFKPYRKESENE